MSNLSILISGAGIAGPVLAFFLARAGANVSIVERAPALRTGGQNVDIRGVGLEVVRRMGLEAAVRRRTTQEEGVAFVDAADYRRALFPVDPTGRSLSMTAEVEIMRGDLAGIFCEAARGEGGVEYMFGNSISKMDERDDIVHVTFADHLSRSFDLVIAADGLGSPTRSLVFDADVDSTSQSPVIRSLGQYVSWFSIPRSATDGTWARWYNAPRRRLIFLRPDTECEASQLTRASIWICSEAEQLRGYSKLDVPAQKALMHELFDDAGWEARRVMEGMDSAEDFYMQEVAQVKITSPWSRGRVALLGDAAYCPSPISGISTTVAIVGAYILAGEITRNPTDHSAAFASYERLMRPFVVKAQKLLPGTPQTANPQTAWGIYAFNAFLGFVSWSGLATALGRYAGPPVEAIVLPEYEFRARGGEVKVC